MSELLHISAELAPYFATAAGVFGTALATTAAQRITDESVMRGPGVFRRIFRRDDGSEPALDLTDGLEESRADELLNALGTAEREQLARALIAWLRERDSGLDPDRLLELVRSAASGTTHTTTYNVTSRGAGSLAVGSVGEGAVFHLGGGGDRSSRES
ncbi:hypothetical protein [Streptomyces sp. NPDC093600]|uniref:hypothetical protein n=1 Tax=Streptomyces sp. NPDC093600 TaxID=3366047 RepID=UPI0037FA9920